MLFRPNLKDRFERLEQRIQQADVVTPALMADVVAEGCTRFAALKSSDAARHIDGLIDSQAWTDAALAIIEIELPQWKIRRLAYEDGDWLCSISKELRLPDWLDDAIETRHEVLPLAILCALVEARRNSMVSDAPTRTVPQCPPTQGEVLGTVCCDNFS